jgi:hypothetical protein
MYKIQPVIEHIEKVYGLELVPCSIPRSQFQYFKRSFYLFIHNKVSQKLFYFLRDKVSPIKFLDERPKGEIWFRKRNSEGKVSIEVEIKPLPTYQFIFSNDSSGLFHPINKEGENYEVKIYEQLSDFENIEFPLNHINGKEQVDYYFSKVDELKQILRDYKLKNILN